jgi:hypothetical protein
MELAAILVGLAVAIIYYAQLTAMRGQLGELIRQYPELQKSAEAAKAAAIAAQKGVEQSEKSFRLDQRAWVMPFSNGTPTFVGGANITFPFGVTNTGKTPAVNVDGDVVVALLTKNERPQFVYTQHSGHPLYKIKGGLVFPNQPQTTQNYAVLEHGKEVIKRKAKTVLLTLALKDELTRGDESWIVVHGQINYGDVFGVPHWVHFCWVATFPGTMDRPLQPGKRECSAHNGVDENDLQPDGK